jgi:oxalate decarboxylase
MPQSDNNLPNWPIFNVENGVCSDAGQGGYMYQVKQEQFAAATTMTGGFLHVNQTSMREIHWHPNADEMQYVLNGTINVTVYGLGDVSATYSIGAGDIGFVPKGYAHYIECISDSCDVLLAFNSPSWTNQELSTLMAVTPTYLTATSLNTTTEVINKYFPKATADFYGPKFDGCPKNRF